LRGTFQLADGTPLPIGGKTGTGDHRLEVYAANGTVIESKVMNRTATFAFFLSNRFFGVMTVFVPGEAAADYRFTSGIAVQIVKDMEPALHQLVLGNEKPDPSWQELAEAFDAESPEPSGSPPKVGPLPPPGTPLTEALDAVGNNTASSTAKQPADPTKAAIKSTPKATPKGSKTTASPATKAAPITASEPPLAPPPPQIDKPDPPPPPIAPPPPAKAEPDPSFTAKEGEGFNFLR